MNYTGGVWDGNPHILGLNMASSHPRVGRDGYGNATVVYSSGNVVYAIRYLQGIGWQDTLGYMFSTGVEPEIAVNPYGNAMTVSRSASNARATRFISGQ